MLINRPIKDIMTAQVISITTDTRLEEAEAMFRKHKVRHLPVTKNKELVGILSLTDLQRISFASSFGEAEDEIDNAMYEMLGVSQIMQSKPVSIQLNASVKDAAEILASREFHALPVVDGNQLVGIITTTDLIKFLLNHF